MPSTSSALTLWVEAVASGHNQNPHPGGHMEAAVRTGSGPEDL